MKTTLSNAADYRRLWIGESVSYMGAQMSVIALPLTAVSLLQASSFDLGMINAFSYAPFILLSLFVGAFVDRSRKRPLLILANLGRAVFLLAIPVSYWLNGLSVPVMCITALLIGACTVVFDAAFHPYIPKLIPKDQLVKANANLIASSSAATAAGPGIGGFIMKLFGSMPAIIINVFSYLFSAIMLIRMKSAEDIPAVQKSRNMKAEITEGLRFITANPNLRAIMGEAATYNFFSQAFLTLVIIYAKDRLHVSELIIGLFFSIGGIGALLGSMVSEYVVKRIGMGPATVWSMVLACSGPILVPLAGGPPWLTVTIILSGFLVNGIGLGLSNVTCITIRQSIIPQRMMATAMSGNRLITWGGIPFGALVGGLLGETIGIRETLTIAGIGLLFAPFWVIFSPLRNRVH